MKSYWWSYENMEQGKRNEKNVKKWMIHNLHTLKNTSNNEFIKLSLRFNGAWRSKNPKENQVVKNKMLGIIAFLLVPPIFIWIADCFPTKAENKPGDPYSRMMLI